MIKELCENDFILQDLTNKSKALIFYKADWCYYCQKFLPTFIKISNEYPNMLFGVVDVDSQKKLIDNNNNLAYSLYEVNSYPTIVLYNKGKYVKTLNNRDENYILSECRNL